MLIAGCATPVYQPWPPSESIESSPLPEPEPAPAPKRKFQRLPMPVTPKDGRPLYAVDISDSSFSALESESSIEDTNSYTYIPFSWNYAGEVDFFRLYYGREPRAYTAFIDLGRTNAYEFSKTNWIEGFDRHWFAVTAFRYGLESDYSNERHYPLYPATHFRLIWSNPAPMTIIGYTNLLMRWPVIIKITSQGQTSYQDQMPADAMFFRSYRSFGPPEVLAVEAFNPLND